MRGDEKFMPRRVAMRIKGKYERGERKSMNVNARFECLLYRGRGRRDKTHPKLYIVPKIPDDFSSFQPSFFPREISGDA